MLQFIDSTFRAVNVKANFCQGHADLVAGGSCTAIFSVFKTILKGKKLLDTQLIIGQYHSDFYWCNGPISDGDHDLQP